MKIKLEKINELESLGFEKMKPYNGEVNYRYKWGNPNAHLRVNTSTGNISIKSNTSYGVYEVFIPEIIKILIEKDFIE